MEEVGEVPRPAPAAPNNGGAGHTGEGRPAQISVIPTSGESGTPIIGPGTRSRVEGSQFSPSPTGAAGANWERGGQPSLSKTDRFVEGILHGADHSLGATLARAGLTLLAGLHIAGLEAYLLPYRTGVRKRYRLPVPVIAIGNISSGGTGKTPMAALVAGHLRDTGHRVVLLSRGHGGSHEKTGGAQVVSDGERVLLGPAEAGDEPILLAHLLPGVPVIVGRDRRKSGRLAMERFAPAVIVLDDALQFWQLHRDLDLVLLDARRPFDNGYVLPRGLLREPAYHLARAGIVVLTRADRVSPEELARTTTRVQHLAPRAAVFTARHAPQGWVEAKTDTVLPVTALAERPVLTFSGIADGRAFTETVRALGAAVTATRDFGDHHAYTAEEIQALAAQVPESGFAATTEKDLVKVAPLWPENGPPLYALRIGMTLEDESRFFTRLDTVLTP